MDRADGRPRLSRTLMVSIFLAALAPRLWALDWGMPLKTAHIDEAVVVFYSLRVVAGDPHPRVFFDYPGFFLYALAALFKGVLLAARSLGLAVPPDADVLAAYTRGDGLLFLLGAARFLNAVLGSLTAVVLARFGRSRWGAFAGVAAALLWAVNPLAVRHAHYATVDMAAAFLTLLAVERLSWYGDEGSLTDGLWSAFFIGLAAATKYYPAVLMAFLLPLAFLRRSRPWRTAGLLCAVAAGTFLAASPYTLLAASDFAGRFTHLFSHIVGGQGARATILLPTLRGLLSNAGFLTCLVGGGGGLLLLRSPRWGDKVTAGVFLFLLLFFGVWNVQLPHYILSLYPLLFLAAGRALSEAGRRQRALGAGGLALLLALTLPRTVRGLSLLSTPDTRLRALAWMREAIPAGGRILRFAHTPEFSPRDPFQVTVDWENKRLEGGVAALDAGDADYLVYGSYVPDGDPVLKGLSSRFELARSFEAPPPDFPHDPGVYVYRVRGKR